MFYTMDADDMATHGAGTSLPHVLTTLSQEIIWTDSKAVMNGRLRH